MALEAELLVTLKPAFTTISPRRDEVASFDREGRLYSYFKENVTYRRTLSSTVEVRRRGTDNSRVRERLDQAEALDLFAQAYDTAAAVYPHADAELRDRLDQEILRWTPKTLLAEADRFHSIYKPITILPPDQYLCIVLQATEGCTWNRCTFCNFYQDRPFRAKTLEEFKAHVEGVKSFFGRGASMRKSLFLADGNALALSQQRIVPMMEVAAQAFPNLPIYSFIDLYTGERRPVDQWRHLRDLGLHRVYIGMETGHDPLLQFLNKPGSQKELIRFVHDLKDAGLLVGLIVMVGVGGQEYREAHAKATYAAIERMPLGQGDLIYLSPFIEQLGSSYIEERKSQGLTPMSEEAVEAELTRLAQQFRSLGFKAARYDIREFMY